MVSYPATLLSSSLLVQIAFLTDSSGFPIYKIMSYAERVLLLSCHSGCLSLFFLPYCPVTQLLKSSLFKEIDPLSVVYVASVSFVSCLLMLCMAFYAVQNYKKLVCSQIHQVFLLLPFPHTEIKEELPSLLVQSQVLH